MSKAFTRDDASEAPLIVPPRAPLPPGTPNYVTARGLALLRDELGALEAERVRRTADRADDADRGRPLAVLAARVSELSTRIVGARVVDSRDQPHDEVRFGATVTLRTVDGPRPGEERTMQIVGVDEADAAAGRVAFVAPIARAVLGLRLGETATLTLARGEETLEVTSISYDGEERR
jgi:transcription elongation factor GreB